ncbi:hypothetical protein [Spirosoma gilvum]
MMLLVDGVKNGIQYENVTHWIQDYESGFELLTKMVTDQWTLKAAILVDNGDCMCLPVEAFDGQPIGIHVQSLQQEWTQLLSTKPHLHREASEFWVKDWCLRLDGYYNGLLGHLEKMIFLLEIRKIKLLAHRNEIIKLLLTSNYDLRLEMNKKLYQQTQKARQKNQQRLLELKKQDR